MQLHAKTEHCCQDYSEPLLLYVHSNRMLQLYQYFRNNSCQLTGQDGSVKALQSKLKRLNVYAL